MRDQGQCGSSRSSNGRDAGHGEKRKWHWRWSTGFARVVRIRSFYCCHHPPHRTNHTNASSASILLRLWPPLRCRSDLRTVRLDGTRHLDTIASAPCVAGAAVGPRLPLALAARNGQSCVCQGHGHHRRRAGAQTPAPPNEAAETQCHIGRGEKGSPSPTSRCIDSGVEL